MFNVDTCYVILVNVGIMQFKNNQQFNSLYILSLCESPYSTCNLRLGVKYALPPSILCVHVYLFE